jgi:hypothetical protein
VASAQLAKARRLRASPAALSLLERRLQDGAGRQICARMDALNS